VFRRDALKTVTTMRETLKKGDIKLFTIAAHSMKTMLANIGENEKSKLASDLEKAGHNSDTAFISANAEHFVSKLQALAESLEPAEKPETVQVGAEELAALLIQLKPLLEKADFKAASFVEKLQRIAGMEELAQRIDDYDFEGALALELLNSL
jgi:HPt (histidine-containing phosphotransfer) domain-containing protein